MKDKVALLVQGLRLRYALIGAGLLVGAMLLALYGSLASAVTTGTTINGCYQNPTNNSTQILPLSVVRTNGSDACPAGYTKLSWNQTGPQGPQGPQGEKGDKGDKGDPGEAATAFTTRADPPVNLTGQPGRVQILAKTVPQGSYAINAKVTLQNIDVDEFGNADCDLRTGTGVVDQGAVVVMGRNNKQDELGTNNAVEYPLQATATNFSGGAITVTCNGFSTSDQIVAANAVLTAIKVGSIQ